MQISCALLIVNFLRMKEGKNRECQMLRQKISEARDYLRPYQSISYKTSEVPRLYNVYGDDKDELVRALNTYIDLVNEVLNYSEELKDRLKGEVDNEK